MDPAAAARLPYDDAVKRLVAHLRLARKTVVALAATLMLLPVGTPVDAAPVQQPGTWAYQPDLPPGGTPAFYSAVTAGDGQIYVMGGYAYSPVLGTWGPVPPLPNPRGGVAVATDAQ